VQILRTRAALGIDDDAVGIVDHKKIMQKFALRGQEAAIDDTVRRHAFNVVGNESLQE
jgi:hypothetical protein